MKLTKQKKIGLNTKPLKFGKYEGLTPLEVAEISPSYIVWMYDSMVHPPCTQHLRDMCKAAVRRVHTRAPVSYKTVFKPNELSVLF